MNSYKTALTRKALTAPVRELITKGHMILSDDTKYLDYGCGKALDADLLGGEKYDVYFYPDKTPLTNNTYNYITCTYVLNTIEDLKIRENILNSILNLLLNAGVAFITVRNDIKKLNGLTSINTWQGHIDLPYEIVQRTSSYITYKMEKHI